MSYLRYALEPTLEALRAVRQPDDERCSQVLVIEITDREVRFDTGLERYAQVPYCGYEFALFRGNIYGGYLAQDRLWKWSNTGMESAAPDEVRAFHAAHIVSNAPVNPWKFDDVDGWSMRSLNVAPTTHELRLNGQPVTIHVNQDPFGSPHAIELMRPGHPSQTIWTFEDRPHRVSKVEYEKVLAPR